MNPENPGSFFIRALSTSLRFKVWVNKIKNACNISINN